MVSRRFKCFGTGAQHLRRQVESIFAEIHSRVEQEADARKIGTRERKEKEAKEWKEKKERVANRAPGATNRISESRP